MRWVLIFLILQKKNEMQTIRIFLIEDNLTQKRKFVIFLVQNFYKRYQVFVPEIKKINDEQFINLYKGNTDYDKFNSFDPKLLKDFFQKFKDNIEILSEWYDKKETCTNMEIKLYLNLKGKNDEEIRKNTNKSSN